MGAQEPHAFRIAEPPEERLAAAESAHGLRIGALPEHPRVLPSRRGHVHDSGQPVHARLRILFGAEGQSRASRTCGWIPREPANVARMAAEMKLRYVVITSVNRDDLADGGSRAFRRDRARGAAGAAGRARGSADARFLRRPGGRGARARCRAARLQSQHGDRAAALPAGASAGRLPAVARRAGVRAPPSSGRADEVRLHGGAGRDARTKCGRCCAICAPPAPTWPPSASICSPRAAICRWRSISSRSSSTRIAITACRIGFKMVFSGPLVRSSYMADEVSDEARRTP